MKSTMERTQWREARETSPENQFNQGCLPEVTSAAAGRAWMDSATESGKTTENTFYLKNQDYFIRLILVKELKGTCKGPVIYQREE